MFNNPYMQQYNSQTSIDRINTQMAELEKLKQQLQQQPTNLTQNFQISPTNQNSMRYANNIEEVTKENVMTDTPFFSKDLSVMWIKNAKGEIKSYELNEITFKDEKDLMIENLQIQINELTNTLKGMNINEPDANIDEPAKNKKSASVSNGRTSSKK